MLDNRRPHSSRPRPVSLPRPAGRQTLDLPPQKPLELGRRGKSTMLSRISSGSELLMTGPSGKVVSGRLIGGMVVNLVNGKRGMIRGKMVMVSGKGMVTALSSKTWANQKLRPLQCPPPLKNLDLQPRPLIPCVIVLMSRRRSGQTPPLLRLRPLQWPRPHPPIMKPRPSRPLLQHQKPLSRPFGVF